MSKAITGLDLLASWIPYGFDWASLPDDDLGTTLAKVGKTLAHSGIL